MAVPALGIVRQGYYELEVILCKSEALMGEENKVFFDS